MTTIGEDQGEARGIFATFGAFEKGSSTKEYHEVVERFQVGEASSILRL